MVRWLFFTAQVMEPDGCRGHVAVQLNVMTYQFSEVE